MKLSSNMVRVRQSDIEHLTAASVKLSEVATAIQSTRATWAALAVQDLREVNDTIVELRNRALAKMNRIAERQQDELDAAASARIGGNAHG